VKVEKIKIYLKDENVMDYLGEGPTREAYKKRQTTDFKRLARSLKTKPTADTLIKDHIPKGLSPERRASLLAI
jgi:hypothetical protein